MSRIWTRLLGGCIAFLALVLVIEWVPSGTPAVTPIQPARLAAASRPGQRMVDRETDAWVRAILARPLFSIGRRPPPVAVNRGGTVQNDVPRLSGIMIAAGVKRAIFAPDGGAKPLVLMEGQAVADTSIRSIEPGEVVLASGEILRPSYDRNRVVPPSPVYPPGLPPPGFPNPSFGNRGLQPPGFQPPNIPPQPFQAPSAAAEGIEPQQPGGLPQFRGMMPQRRE